MRFVRQITLFGAIALLPWQVLAADTTTPAATPAASSEQSKGFNEYWKKKAGSEDGVITKAQWMAETENTFKEIDTNNDGVISKAEMQAYQDKMRAHYMELKAKRERNAPPEAKQ